jgi:hypothetical protein
MTPDGLGNMALPSWTYASFFADLTAIALWADGSAHYALAKKAYSDAMRASIVMTQGYDGFQLAKGAGQGRSVKYYPAQVAVLLQMAVLEFKAGNTDAAVVALETLTKQTSAAEGAAGAASAATATLALGVAKRLQAFGPDGRGQPDAAAGKLLRRARAMQVRWCADALMRWCAGALMR